MNSPFSSTVHQEPSAAQRIQVAVALLVAVLVPLTGYMYLLGGHPDLDQKLPLWVAISIPFSAFGPADPSMLLFLVIAACNAVLWGMFTYSLIRFLRTLFRSR
jgi:hypothetical protein